MTKSEAVQEFKDYVMPGIREYFEQDGIPDWIARREGWNIFTDMLCKNNQITSEQYETWDHPAITNGGN